MDSLGEASEIWQSLFTNIGVLLSKKPFPLGKSKQWIEDSTETKVDNIIAKLTSGEITRSDARDQIMNVDNIAMLGIDENTVDEVIYEAHANA